MARPRYMTMKEYYDLKSDLCIIMMGIGVFAMFIVMILDYGFILMTILQIGVILMFISALGYRYMSWIS